jgi:hypothetical protein
MTTRLPRPEDPMPRTLGGPRLATTPGDEVGLG